MKVDNDLCLKFPIAFRDKLLKGELEFPENTLFEYDKLYVYRAVERKHDDFHEIDMNDFKSYFDLKKMPKKKLRGTKSPEQQPQYYGVSSFLQEERVEQIMKFPNPNKKMACGYVYKEGGPQETNIETQHVCWWLYKDTQVQGFRLKGV